MPDTTICIPVRKDGNPYVTLKSLSRQTDQDFDVVIVWDHESKGANWARNRAFQQATTEFVLFSDDDIEWESPALAWLKQTLREHPAAAYAYGLYRMGDRTYCSQQFDPELLRRTNYISTMSLVRREQFCGFDEKIQRLQDWDAWLTMLDQGKVGVNCNQLLFTTRVRLDGITYGGGISYTEAERIVKEKHPRQ